MKKMMIALVILLVVVVGGLATLRFVNFNHLGAEQYYVKITTDGAIEKETLDNGKVYETYWYKAYKAYNEEGKEISVDFSAQKNLRHDAYLRVYYKESKGITSYEEVQENEVPKKALEQL